LSRPAIAVCLSIALAAGCTPGPTRAKAPTLATEGTVAQVKTTLLKGLALAPPGLLGNNGSALIANNGSGVVSNNSGGLVSNNSAGYRVQETPSSWQAVPNATVVVVDQFHRPVKGIPPATTDAKGNFTLKNVPIGLNWLIEVQAPKGKLSTLVRPTAATDALKVTPASTLVTEHLRQAFTGQKVALRQVPLESFDVLTKSVEEVLQKESVSLDLTSSEKAAQVFDQVAAKHDDIKSEGKILVLDTQRATDTAIQTGALKPEEIVEPSPTPPPASPMPLPSDLVSTLSGAVTTLAGDGTPGSGDTQFNVPTGAAQGPDGAIYVIDENNHAVRKILQTPFGTTVSVFAGGSGAGYQDQTLGDGLTAKFDNPEGLAVDGSGRVFVADSFNHAIRAIVPNGAQRTVMTVAGNDTADFADGDSNTARFNEPKAVVAASNNTLYVADSGNHCIRKIVADIAGQTATVTTIAGVPKSPGFKDGDADQAQFKYPEGLFLRGNTLYVADSQNHRIRRLLLDQTPIKVETVAGDGTPGFKDGDGAAAQFKNPQGLVVDSHGIVYVADTENNRIRAINTNKQVVTIAGDGTKAWKDGTGAAAQLGSPEGLCLNGQEKLIVADSRNHRIRKVE
jgi:sugar lactone lactonase YvrE